MSFKTIQTKIQTNLKDEQGIDLEDSLGDIGLKARCFCEWL